MLMPLAIAAMFFRIGMNTSIPESLSFPRLGLTEKAPFTFGNSSCFVVILGFHRGG